MGKWGRYIKAKPAEIRGGADAAEEIGDTLRKQADFARDESRSASSANEGFDAGTMLEQALSVWEENWGRLAGSVSGVGERLRKCADTYDEADQRNAQGFDVIAGRG